MRDEPPTERERDVPGSVHVAWPYWKKQMYSAGAMATCGWSVDGWRVRADIPLTCFFCVTRVP